MRGCVVKNVGGPMQLVSLVGEPDFEAAYKLSVYFGVIDKIFTILFTVEIVLKVCPKIVTSDYGLNV